MDPRALAAATPADRNRVVDFLRAAAILTVVLGHWLMAAVMVQDGRLVPNAVLNIAPWSHPLTWVFQVMPLFFIVGGYANGLSWRSARRRGDGYAGWLRSRLQRLAAPVLPLLVVWLAIASIAYAAGVPGATLRTASQVALVPTWFLAAYIVVVAVAPLLLALWERVGWWSVAAGLAVGGLVDWWSIAGDNHWVGFANYLVVWATVHQLGFAWLDGALASRGRRVALAAAGVVGLVALVSAGPYPVSMIGVDGAVLNNSYPTRVTLAFLGLAQAGVVLLAERRLATLLERPRIWAVAVVINLRIMSLYLWHLTAMVLVIGMSLLAGGLGLRAAPLTGSWWATRPVWFAVLASVTGGLVLVFGRFETPIRDRRPAPAVWRPAVATAAVCGGLGVMAASGIVSREGVHWIWPLLPVAAVVGLGVVPLPHRRTEQ
ncbi:Acyltransferase family protein [Pedococcus dokdonensis]|uniref:Acyltransferase family protein n=1 Tax=Pedococcus dokdonensis TaxID=443156 RepID=A0A1H0T5H3_9MICO|nr:acyltransferase [Pedococcus dokdonensis]SDP48828.1 Acyltransferase family protein [Pedococcus dokdonensis]